MILRFGTLLYRFKKTHKEIRKNEMKERQEERYPLIDKIWNTKEQMQAYFTTHLVRISEYKINCM